MPSIPTTAAQRRILKRFGVDLELDADILERFLRYTQSKVVNIRKLVELATWAHATDMCRKSGIWKD